MTAKWRSRMALLSLSLAVASLVGIFVILDASSVNASRGFQVAPVNYPSSIVISPTELQASLYPDEQLTQTLWITNSGNTAITFTIYELSAPIRLAGFSLQPAQVPLVNADVEAATTKHGKTMVIISLREVPDLSGAYLISNKEERRSYVFRHLQETTTHSQELFNWLVSQGSEPHRLITANAISAQIDTRQLASLAMNPLVGEISLSQQYTIITNETQAPVGPVSPMVPPTMLETIGWNLLKIRADEAWNSLGITGQGAVVGVVDTGVMYYHPALSDSYRGNLGGGNFDHNFNWFDFVNGQPTPYDPVGHGTMGTGIISGDDGAGNQIGVAPGTKWIATRACDYACSDIDLLDSLAWMLAPTDLNGQNPDPAKAPDVVLGMWGGQACDNFFETSLQALRAAGILAVFSPGHNGPSCFTVGSPADSGSVLAAGATDQDDLIAIFSSRGPSCYGSIKPDLSAPGVNIRTSDNNGDYLTTSGTSWSAAHTAGAAAMVVSAYPSLSLEEVTEILFTTAICIDDSQCGGDVCPEPNNVYGHGRIDVYEAVYQALSNPPHVELPWLSEDPNSGTIEAGSAFTVSIHFDTSGLQPGSYSGALGIISSDPEQPFISVPVNMQVLNPPMPIINIEPRSFSANLPVGGSLTDTLIISNQGDALLSFSLYEISTTKRITNPPVELLPPDLIPADNPILVDQAARTQLLLFGQSRLIVYLRGKADFVAAARILDKTERGQYVYSQLLRLASQSDGLYNWLLEQGTQPHRLLTANAIAATLDAKQLEMLLKFPQVGRVGINGYAEIIRDEVNTEDDGILSPNTVEWNIAKIRADEVWSTFGITGKRATVGIIDTGVMLNHPALNNQYRGNQGDGNYDHNFNWYDFVGGQATPFDDNGHGTFGAGIVLGDDGGNNQIGVAPGAKWVAVKVFDAYGGTTEERLHSALEWMLAPTDLTGNNPDPAQAPQIVLNMWFWNMCEQTFEPDLASLWAANILPVFAPEMLDNCQVSPPAASPYAISAGSTDLNDVISPASSFGPSCFDETLIKPDLAAPGVQVRSSTIDGGYGIWSGTSFSTAHLAGAAALLFSADPHLSILQLEQTLFDTAVCLDDHMYCGGESCPGANNTYGYGRIDAFEAVSTTLGSQFDIPWLNVGPISAELPPGDSMLVNVIFSAEDLLPGAYFGGIAVESNDPQAPFSILPITLTVYSDCQPITDLSMDITGTFRVGDVLTFTAISDGSPPILFTWYLADGSIEFGEELTHIYESQGLYFVTLTAENACSGPLEIWQLVTIYEPLKIWLPVIRK